MALRLDPSPLLAFLLTAAALWPRALAQSSCTAVIVSLAPCLDFLSNKSPLPNTQCCSQFESVVKADPMCLCAFLKGSMPIGVNVNQTRALDLPAACKVETPPVSQCSSGAAGTASPHTDVPSMGGGGSPPVKPPEEHAAPPSEEGEGHEKGGASNSLQWTGSLFLIAAAVTHHLFFL